MTIRRRARRQSRRPRSRRPGNTHCLNILRRLSAYLDEDLPTNVCDEIRRHLGACPNCETFVASLRQTIALCRYAPPAPLSAADKAQLRRQIMRAAC